MRSRSRSTSRSIRCCRSHSPDWTSLAGDRTPDVLARCLDPLKGDGWLYFVCGPPVMINAVEHALLDRGVPSSRIIEERFKYD